MIEHFPITSAVLIVGGALVLLALLLVAAVFALSWWHGFMWPRTKKAVEDAMPGYIIVNGAPTKTIDVLRAMGEVIDET